MPASLIAIWWFARAGVSRRSPFLRLVRECDPGIAVTDADHNSCFRPIRIVTLNTFDGSLSADESIKQRNRFQRKT
jgi:hypothetical protein